MKTAKTKLKQQESVRRSYGVDHPSKSDVIKQRKKETLKKNYGVENPSHSEEIKKKRQETFEQFFEPQSTKGLRG